MFENIISGGTVSVFFACYGDIPFLFPKGGIFSMHGGFLKKLLIVGLAVGGAYLVFKLALPTVLPFALALALAFCLQPAVRILSARLGGRRRPVAAVLVAVGVLSVGALLFLLTSRLLTETWGFLNSFIGGAEGGIDGFFDRFDAWVERIPLLAALGGELSDILRDGLRGLVSDLTASLPSLLTQTLSALPSFLLFTVILIMASYYFAADYDEITERILSSLPLKARNALSRYKQRMMNASFQYLRSCLLLAFITFVELTVGFLTLGIPYAFSFAIIIALVDMLPILGAGTVMIPWAIWEWLTGNGYYAVGLLIILTVVTVVRRFSEPRIIGTEIGLSPLTTLFSMYLGFRFFGFVGLFFAPLAAVLILNAFPEDIAKKLGLKFDSEINGGDGAGNALHAEENT